MNNRIQELGRQAQIWCDQNIPGEFNEITGGYGHHWEEKFAALIIQECADIADKHVQSKLYEDYTLGTGNSLKKHFGVE